MNIERIDHYCDLFEQALKRGSQLSIGEFLAEFDLPSDDRLLAELQKLEQEYRNGRRLSPRPTSDTHRPQPIQMPILVRPDLSLWFGFR